MSPYPLSQTIKARDIEPYAVPSFLPPPPPPSLLCSAIGAVFYPLFPSFSPYSLLLSYFPLFVQFSGYEKTIDRLLALFFLPFPLSPFKFNLREAL